MTAMRVADGREPMNRPDKAGEPSMEEILASIRQIIADDPAPDRNPIRVEPNPLVPQAASAERKGDSARGTEPSTPMVDRLSDVLKSGPLPPTSPLGSKRPFSFDQDLADIFEEPGDSNGAPVPTPKPDLRVPLEFSSSISKPVSPAAKDDKPSSLPSLANGAAALPPQLALSEPSVPPLPFGATPTQPADAVAPPPRSFGFPLRKQGFIPAQTKLPVLPPIPPPASADAAGRGEDDDGLEKALERLSGLGAVVPGQSTTAAAADPFTSSFPAAATEIAPAQLPIPELAPIPEPAAVPPAELLSSPTISPPLTFGAPINLDKPLREEPSFASTSRPSVTDIEVPFRSADQERSAVAANALDALAQGLAASAAHVQEPAVALTPVVEVLAEPQPSAPPSQVAGAQPTPPRTLEDAVAEMLRPMLQKWVAENMPRIIEKALRVEVARTTKPGSSSS